MKSKISFCDLTVLKKDVTRFLPLWLIYLIGALLVTSTSMGNLPGTVAGTLCSLLAYGMPAITCIYALLTAITLFGDLFVPRMCNALHALPLRRETWFSTHFLAGLAMFLLPNAFVCVVLMTMLDTLWYLALAWLGTLMLLYLFFFGLAVLSVMLTGNRFATALVYALFNFFILEIYWLIAVIIQPSLYGVRFDTSPLFYFSPVVKLSGWYPFTVEHSCPQTNNHIYSALCTYSVQFDGAAWRYLAILAVIGIGLAIGALVLYRKRRLESAGDFAAFVPMHWVVPVFGSTVCGILFTAFALDTDLQYAFLLIGVTVGFFLLEMLLQRKMNIFKRSVFLKWGAIILAFVLILVGTATDICGIEDYIPRADKVETVIVVDGYLDNEDLSAIRDGTFRGHSGYIIADDAAAIATVLDAHTLALNEERNTTNARSRVTIQYLLKDGRTITRCYSLITANSAYGKFKSLFVTSDYIFNGISEETTLKYVQSVGWNGYTLPNRAAEDLIHLLYRDAEDGLLYGEDDDSFGRFDTSVSILLSKDALTDGAKTIYVSMHISRQSKSYLYLTTDLKTIFSDPEYLFGGINEDLVYEYLTKIDAYGMDDDTYRTYTDDDAKKVFTALVADATAGNLSQEAMHHKDNALYMLTVSWCDDNTDYSIDIMVFGEAENLCQLLGDS